MPRGQVSIQVDRDRPHDCAYVDARLAASLKTGRRAKILRNSMVMFAAGIPQQVRGHDYLFDPEAICQTIKLLEGENAPDLTIPDREYLREIEREGVGITQDSNQP